MVRYKWTYGITYDDDLKDLADYITSNIDPFLDQKEYLHGHSFVKHKEFDSEDDMEDYVTDSDYDDDDSHKLCFGIVLDKDGTDDGN